MCCVEGAVLIGRTKPWIVPRVVVVVPILVSSQPDVLNNEQSVNSLLFSVYYVFPVVGLLDKSVVVIVCE